MPAKKHLFIGFGDIASRCAEKLIADGEHVVGIARSPRIIPVGVEFWQGDITSKDLLACVADQQFSSVVITLTPDGRDADAYQRAYLLPIQGLIDAWQTGCKPAKVLFISSTRVYGQNDGSWVDEESPTVPADAQGEILLQAETTLRTSGLSVCVLRFSGIYGPGRDKLIRQVKAGQPGDDHFTNRIHIDDCCGVIVFLLRQVDAANLPSVLLASDNSPVESSMIRAWLAEQLHVTPPSENKSKHHAGNKRCLNSRLIALGYTLRYPTYTEGYTQLLQHI